MTLSKAEYGQMVEDRGMILLVIDTQKGITDNRLFAFEKFRENVKTLLSAARENGVEVV